MGKLPEGWVTTHLSEICSKPQYGYTTKSSSMGDVKFLRTTDITKGAVDWSSVPYCMDAPEDVSKYQLQDRDIVISRAGSVGFSFWYKTLQAKLFLLHTLFDLNQLIIFQNIT